MKTDILFKNIHSSKGGVQMIKNVNLAYQEEAEHTTPKIEMTTNDTIQKERQLLETAVQPLFVLLPH